MRVSKIFQVAAGLVILAAAVAGFYYVAQLPSGEPKSPAPAVSSSGPTRRLTLHEEPRPLPALQFANGEGQNMSLADFQGRVVLLNIWATWCVPCRKEMPTLDRLQEQLGSPEFEVVVLSIDQGGTGPVQTFFNETSVRQLSVYVDTSGRTGRELKIIGLPTTLLIDREGRERARLIGPAEWDSPEIVSVIKQVLASPPAARGKT